MSKFVKIGSHWFDRAWLADVVMVIPAKQLGRVGLYHSTKGGEEKVFEIEAEVDEAVAAIETALGD